MKKNILTLLPALLLLCGCRGDFEELVPSTWTDVTTSSNPRQVLGFYLLNEGNMGTNKCTLDYFDYTTGYYRENIYAETNPSVPLELGDVGNDIQTYGDRLYAVINCSNFVEVMDKNSAMHIGSVDIPNCRYITFKDGYAYVSSYAGLVQEGVKERYGYVAKVDTATLEVVGRCAVGYQPEEMVVVGDRLYVANSGGYRAPKYDNTVSVIDLNTFKETKKIEVAINLHRLRADSEGYLWVSSRGDYDGTGSDLIVIDPRTDRVVQRMGVPATEMCIDGDSLYLYSTEYSLDPSVPMKTSYAVIDTRTRQVATRSFITDGTDKEIQIPYGIAVNPETKEIIVTDAKTYVVDGTVYCFGPDGRKKWSVKAGMIPAHVAFRTK